MVGERNGWKNTHTVFQNSLEPEWNAHQSLHYPTYECTGMGENGSSRSGDEPALPTGGSRPRTTRRCLITPWGRGGRGGRLEEVTQTGVHRHSLPFSKKKRAVAPGCYPSNLQPKMHPFRVPVNMEICCTHSFPFIIK